MATNPNETYDTVEKNEAAEEVAAIASSSTQNKTLVVQSSMQTRLSQALINLSASFLNNSELANFSRVAHFSRNACTREGDERKIIQELLSPISSARTSGVSTFFTKYPQTKPERLVAETSFREVRESKKVSEAERLSGKLTTLVSVRYYDRASAIKLAAFTLNHFLLIKLLTRIINDEVETKDEKPRLKAKKQLQEVRSRIVTKEKNVGAAPIAPTHTHTSEKKGSADFAKNAAPVKAYLQACSNYIAQEAILFEQDNEVALNRLMDTVGDRWNALFDYVKRQFFKAMRWSDDPDFQIEPPEGELRLGRNGPLVDSDSIGGGTFTSVVKGGGAGVSSVIPCPAALGRMMIFSPVRDFSQMLRLDSEAIGHLCELRAEGLDNIIDKLETLETALTLVTVEKSPSQKP